MAAAHTRQETQFEIWEPKTLRRADFSCSPLGRSLVYVFTVYSGHISSCLWRMLKNDPVLWCSNANWLTYNSIPTPATQREHQTHRIKGSALENRPPSGASDEQQTHKAHCLRPTRAAHRTQKTPYLHLMVYHTPTSEGDVGSIPGSGRSPGWRNGYPLWYSCLESPMDREAWRATVHRTERLSVQASRTWLKKS